MNRNITIITLIVILVMSLAFFVILRKHQSEPKNSKGTDYALVFNGKGKKVGKVTNKKDIEFLSNLSGNVGGNSKNTKNSISSSKLKYHYKLKQQNSNVKVNLYVYSNKKVSVKMPFLSKSSRNLSVEQYKKLVTIPTLLS